MTDDPTGLASFAIGAGVGALGFSGLSAAVAGEAGEFGFGYAYDRLNGYDHDTALHNNLIGLGIGAGLGLAGWAFSGGLRNADFSASHSHIDEYLDPHSMNADPTAPRLGRSLDDPNAPRYRSDGGGCVNSFSAQTSVATTDGDVAISAIREGDIVLAYNEATGEIGEYVVTDTISHVDPIVVLLTIDGETLTTTAEHPFYTISGEWVNAGELEIGDEIVSLDGSGTVESLAVVVDPQPMYNLTVDEAHTFFVGDGDWLVHNCETIVTRDFAHSTSLENIDNIMKNGLSENAALNNSRRGLVSRAGSFFTVEVTPESLPKFSSDLIAFGRRHTVGREPAILIMSMPEDMFQGLSATNFAYSRSVPGVEHLTEVIFSPKAFPSINQGIKDGKVTLSMLDPFRHER